MNANIHRFCAYSGLVFIGLFMIAMMFVIPFIPPVSPAAGSAEVAQLFRDHSMGIRIACALMMYACAFGWCWTASVAIWTAKMEGSMPVLSVSQCLCGIFSFGGSYFTVIAWVSATFRPDQPEHLIYLMSDQGWFWIVMMGSCAVMQMIFVGLAVLNDKSAEPIFPRWVGYCNIWLGVMQIPGVTVPFFKQGPFAWDGFFAFWMPLTTFSLWIFVDTWAVLRAIKREDAKQKAVSRV
jgi:hypothetical protein